jgi:DNA integrity scanning protein DisA with diadenylate cyclase activity
METLSSIRFVDIVDILIVTALVTVAIVWIRRTRVDRIALIFILLAGLYIVARLAGLSLLSGLFEGSLALYVLVAVVIFQKELRRFFEGIAGWGLGRPSRSAKYDPTDLLVECLSTLSQRAIGALIVLPGGESIEGHVEGGIDLDGKLSRPLLYSIFDPNSVGHDGAVVVDGDRVTKFSVHSICGILRSIKATSYASFFTASRASWPLPKE